MRNRNKFYFFCFFFTVIMRYKKKKKSKTSNVYNAIVEVGLTLSHNKLVNSDLESL